MPDKKIQVVALGCRLNFFEAEIMKENAKKNALENTIIINTCTVTQEAHRQSMQKIRQLKKQNPTAKIFVTGCASQMDLETYQAMPEVDKIISNEDKLKEEAYTSNERIVFSTPSTSEKLVLPQIRGFENKTRAFIQIQQGCDHRCSFCIIYQARGKSKSLAEEDIIMQIERAVSFGHKEVVLTGVDISSWGINTLNKDPSKIGYLCKSILEKVPSLARLRLSSLDPAIRDENILDLLRNEARFMPHIHLSLQSLNDSVLRNMGRRHLQEGAFSWIESLKEANKDVAIGADIICGFPRETEEQFIDTLNAIKELQIPFLHIFPYSERKGTVAAKMKQLEKSIRKRRANYLKEIAKEIKQDFFKKKVGRKEEILIEAGNCGYTRDYSYVKIINKEVQSKEIRVVEIIDYNENHLIAKV